MKKCPKHGAADMRITISPLVEGHEKKGSDVKLWVEVWKCYARIEPPNNVEPKNEICGFETPTKVSIRRGRLIRE